MSATEAQAMFRSKELSPVELMAAVIDRAEAVDGEVNAFCHTYYERAMDQAKLAEQVFVRDPESARLLEGLPVGLKDEVEVAGDPATMASLAFKDEVAEHTGPTAERLLANGAIIHARTTTPEFSCAGFTHSKLYGVTRNPWNLHYGVGGSSGGSGAALAAGTATLATGSDIGGSIRIPSSFNGVVGFKPLYGRVPVEAPFNMDTYCHNGPMARTVADCLLFENSMVGPHPDDHTSLRPKLVLPERLPDAAGLRVGYAISVAGLPVDPDVARNTQATVLSLADAGVHVEEVDLGVDRELLMKAIGVHYQTLFAAWIGGIAEQFGDLLNDYAIEFAAMTARQGAGLSVLEGMVMETEIWRAVSPVLERFDALIVPTAGTRGLVAGDGYADHGLEVDGVMLDGYFDSIFTPLFNVLSRCPVLNVPSGFADNGVPTGIQIVGRTYDDEVPFRIGAALEHIQPFWRGRRPAFEAAPFE
jgi:Asp-tRNA(Asn)/Glu-tRNA(Gln) amidotransferase A subunit family amidase